MSLCDNCVFATVASEEYEQLRGDHNRLLETLEKERCEHELWFAYAMDLFKSAGNVVRETDEQLVNMPEDLLHKLLVESGYQLGTPRLNDACREIRTRFKTHTNCEPPHTPSCGNNIVEFPLNE